MRLLLTYVLLINIKFQYEYSICSLFYALFHYIMILSFLKKNIDNPVINHRTENKIYSDNAKLNFNKI